MNYRVRLFASLRIFLLASAVPLASCDEGGSTGGVTDFANATCRQLYDGFIARMSDLDRTCDVASDCVTLGGSPSSQYCDGLPALGEHVGGTTASRDAYEAAPTRPSIDRIVEEWNLRCAGRSEICGVGATAVPCIADAAQFPTECVNHVCTEQGDSCF